MDNLTNVECSCDEWQENIADMISCRQFSAIHGCPYIGDDYEYCPFCGKELTEK
jgi:hypothetical protein